MITRSRRVNTPVTSPTSSAIHAARIVRDAAYELASDDSVIVDHRRCREVAARLEFALAEADPARDVILAAGPSITERSGRQRSLVELVESEPGDDRERLRLAKLFLRALDWA